MKLIVILGQTSSGKSKLAVQLAKKMGNSCIVGCDSRQVYRQLDFGTGKINGKWVKNQNNGELEYWFDGVNHFLIDFVDPNVNYNLSDYVKDFYDLTISLKGKYKNIILTGGTFLYAKTILEKVNIGEVSPSSQKNYDLYKSNLKSETLQNLQTQFLNKFNVSTINNSDFNNPVRLVSRLLKKQATKSGWLVKNNYFEFESQKVFCIEVDQDELKTKISTRLQKRLNMGIINETDKIMYLGRDRIWQLGLEYRLSWLFLHGMMTTNELQKNLIQENTRYAKRQLTWLKKQSALVWLTPTEILEYDFE